MMREGESFIKVATGKVEHPSAQRTEVVALEKALAVAPGKSVNIFTDSAFGYFLVHRDLGAWKRNDWKTVSGEPPKHEEIVRKIDENLWIPSEIAVIKVAAHKSDGTIR